jgi:signal peptidase I
LSTFVAARQTLAEHDSVSECGLTPASGQPCPEPTDERADSNFIKRIVAGPGDRVYIENGHPVVNGIPAEEPFTRPCPGSGADWIIGQAFLTYWPPDRVGAL